MKKLIALLFILAVMPANAGWMPAYNDSAMTIEVGDKKTVMLANVVIFWTRIISSNKVITAQVLGACARRTYSRVYTEYSNQHKDYYPSSEINAYPDDSMYPALITACKAAGYTIVDSKIDDVTIIDTIEEALKNNSLMFE